MTARLITKRGGWMVGVLLAVACRATADVPNVEPVPDAERTRLGLSPFYTQYCSADGFPIVASDRVNPFALREAVYLINTMFAPREDVRRGLIEGRVRFGVMAVSEMTTDIPEHSDLTPKEYWDRRARGLGATRERPCVSCGEENLLGLEGDPYRTENILIHEFAHAIHEVGLRAADRTFDRRLRETFDAAKAEGLWKDTYAMVNRSEYWAEGTQSWFDCNRANDSSHNDIDTREKLKAYDARLATLLAEVYGDGTWRYQRPERRTEAGHLTGFDRTSAATFRWPQPPSTTTTRPTSGPADR